jgi:hypothetical protein
MGDAAICSRAAKEVTGPAIFATAALTSPGSQSISKRRSRRAAATVFPPRTPHCGRELNEKTFRRQAPARPSLSVAFDFARGCGFRFFRRCADTWRFLFRVAASG